MRTPVLGPTPGLCLFALPSGSVAARRTVPMTDTIARRTLAYLKRLDEEQNARGAVVDARPNGQEAQALQPDADDAAVRMRIPTDAWRVIIDFAAPAKVTRHLAARAGTLDEFVRRELENKPDEWNETLCVKHAVTHTRTRLDLLNTLRLVATEWRTLVDYDSESTRQLALPTDLHINFDSDDVRARFRNCEILTIDGGIVTTATATSRQCPLPTTISRKRKTSSSRL